MATQAKMAQLKKKPKFRVRFRNAHASPQCSPARVCVQTGQSTPRNGFSVFMNSRGQEYYNEKQYKGYPVISCVSGPSRPAAEKVTLPTNSGVTS